MQTIYIDLQIIEKKIFNIFFEFLIKGRVDDSLTQW